MDRDGRASASGDRALTQRQSEPEEGRCSNHYRGGPTGCASDHPGFTYTARMWAILRRRPTLKTRCSATGARRMSLSPPADACGERDELAQGDLSQVFAEEGGDRVEGGAGRALFVVDIDDLDVAARFAVIRDKPLGLVTRKVRIVVVIIVHDVGAALHPQRRRRRHLLDA